ncbi:hypothetical protein, partial [Vibrio parahaemolyticus]|uniref:hypothetical protein n=1 Tax=Vibrio parahaemolyticus TaxID=670 RepID=UPI002153A2CC
ILLCDSHHFGRGGHSSEIIYCVKHFFKIISFFFLALPTLLKPLRALALSTKWHYRDRAHIGKRYFAKIAKIIIKRRLFAQSFIYPTLPKTIKQLIHRVILKCVFLIPLLMPINKESCMFAAFFYR